MGQTEEAKEEKEVPFRTTYAKGTTYTHALYLGLQMYRERGALREPGMLGEFVTLWEFFFPGDDGLVWSLIGFM